MKKTIYWKKIADNLKLEDCDGAFHNRAYKGTLYDNIRISNGKHTLEFGKNNFSTELFTLPEMTTANWAIYVPDYEQEQTLTDLRERIKNANCTGITFAKIDHMSIEEIWKAVERKFDKETMVKMITLFIDNVYLSNKTLASLPKKVSIRWNYDMQPEVYDIRDLVDVTGSRASNEYCEVTFKKDSEFAKLHGTNSMDVVSVDFI